MRMSSRPHSAKRLGKKPSGGHFNILMPASPFCATWPDRNRRSILPNQDTLSRVYCLPHRSAQASKCRTLLVAYLKEQNVMERSDQFLELRILALLSNASILCWCGDNLFPNARGMSCRPQKKSTGQNATMSRAFPAAFP